MCARTWYNDDSSGRQVLLFVIIAFRTVNCIVRERGWTNKKIRGRSIHINSSRVCGRATWFHPSFSSSCPSLGIGSPILASSYSSLSAMGSYKGRVLTRPSMRSSQARLRIGISFLRGLRDCRPRRGLLGIREVTSDSFSSASSRSSVGVLSA